MLALPHISNIVASSLVAIVLSSVFVVVGGAAAGGTPLVAAVIATISVDMSGGVVVSPGGGAGWLALSSGASLSKVCFAHLRADTVAVAEKSVLATYGLLSALLCVERHARRNFLDA